MTYFSLRVSKKIMSTMEFIDSKIVRIPFEEEEELQPQRGRREYSVCSFYSLIRWPLDKG